MQGGTLIPEKLFFEGIKVVAVLFKLVEAVGRAGLSGGPFLLLSVRAGCGESGFILL